MLAYLVLAGNDGAPVSPELIAQFDRDDLIELPFQPDARTVWRNHDGGVVFIGWQAFTEVAGIGSHWAIDEGGLTAFSGSCWPRDTGWTHGSGVSWAAQLRTYLGESPDPPALRETFSGHFTIVSLPTLGTGWVMPDWTSVDQLFVSRTERAVAVSNRAGLCARAVTPASSAPARSLMSTGWLMGAGWILDQESGYWDVERPHAGGLVVIEPGNGARIIEPAISPLYPSEEELPAPSYEETLRDVEHELRSTIRAVANLPADERVLLLTGGKDSRTLLAVILSEGVQDRFRFQTTGAPESADVLLAGSIAAQFGLDWSYVDPSGRPPEAELDNLLRHSYLVEGMASAWSISARPVVSTGVELNGTSGEGLRWGKVSGSAAGAQTIDEVIARLWIKEPFDILRVLKPEVRQYYIDYVNQWFQEQAELGVALVSLPALYFHETFMHARIGPDIVWNTGLRVDPYMTPACIRATHRLAVDQRPELRYLIDIQRCCCPQLSKMPFTGEPWPRSVFEHLPEADDYRAIEAVHTRDANGRSWRLKHFADYAQTIEPVVLDTANPIHDILDHARLADRIATATTHDGRARLVWGVFCAAAWIGGHERPVKLART